MNTFDTLVIAIGISVASTLLVNHLTNNGKDSALPANCGSKAKQPIAGPLTRRFSNARCIGDKSAVESEMQACPLGRSCNAGGVCAYTFNKDKPNGRPNINVENSGALQSWSGKMFSCGRTACYAAAVTRATSCVTQVVATQGAQGNCGWGKCGDFNSCC